MPDRQRQASKRKKKLNFNAGNQSPKPKKQEIKRQAKGKSEAKTKPKGQIRNTGSAQGPNRGTTRLALKYTCANDLMKLRWTRKKRGQEHTHRGRKWKVKHDRRG